MKIRVSESSYAVDDMGVIFADIGRTEEDLWDGETLVGHPQGLLGALVERFARITYPSWPACGVVREDVLLDYRVRRRARAVRRRRIELGQEPAKRQHPGYPTQRSKETGTMR